jgi:hypothetical protein
MQPLGLTYVLVGKTVHTPSEHAMLMLCCRKYLLVVSVLTGWLANAAWAQTKLVDTLGRTRDEHPKKASFIAETDQRFTFFKDTRSEQNRHTQVNLWGARAGVLFPSNIKVGVGYYFTYQNLNDSERQWREFKLLDRRIRFATVYLEKYWCRREHWEFSTPVEVGWGFSKYSFFNLNSGQQEERVVHSMPVGVGGTFAVKFPPLGPIRATRWFGLSLLTGYRFSVRQDFPASPINWNGFYYSVGPAFFFDRFTQDIAKWRQKRKAKKAARS